MSQIQSGTNRRGSRRRPPKGSTKVKCYRGLMGLGANLALCVLDVSETGASLVMNTAFKVGEETELHLEGVAHRKPIKKAASVVWCVPTTEGRFLVGVKFHSVLNYADLNDLTRT